MKHIYLFCVAVLACTASLAQSVLTLASTDGSWTSESDWSPKRLPANGDILIIPANKTLKVDRSVKANDIHLKVYGKIILTEKATILDLNGSSDVYVYDGGTIEGTEANQQLRIGNNIVYLGNEPPVLGPVYATPATTDFMAITVTTLPVKFLGFSLTRQGSDVLVQWSTAEEANALAFEVERSTDGNTWSRIASVPARGNSSSLTTYTYSDKNVTAAVAYYRIRQVDIDGKSMYTSIQSVKSAAAAGDVKVAAISNRLVLQFPAQVKGAVEARVMTLSGQVVSKQALQQPVGQVFLNTPPVKGAYIISVSNGQEINVAKQVVL